MNAITIIILFTILISVIFDAFRDSWVTRHPNVGWWRWHSVKWTSFFSPLILLSYFYFQEGGFIVLTVVIFLVFALICLLVWRWIYGKV